MEGFMVHQICLTFLNVTAPKTGNLKYLWYIRYALHSPLLLHLKHNSLRAYVRLDLNVLHSNVNCQQFKIQLDISFNNSTYYELQLKLLIYTLVYKNNCSLIRLTPNRKNLIARTVYHWRNFDFLSSDSNDSLSWLKLLKLCWYYCRLCHNN